VKEPLRRVNESILEVLQTVTVAQLSEDTSTQSESPLVELKGIEHLSLSQ
jgi:hypothetical protein